MGTPDRVDEHNDFWVYRYPSAWKSRPHQIAVDKWCNCVEVMYITILTRNIDEDILLQDILDFYGEPEAVVFASLYNTAFIFASKGVVATTRAGSPPEMSVVLSIDYYEPLPLPQFMEKWHRAFILDRAVSGWEEYYYEPEEKQESSGF